jgi:5'-nucleotidase
MGMRILVTNDDGVFSEGVRILAKAMEVLGEVFVVAPDREQSAVGHSLTLHRPLRVEEVSPRIYAVDGTPVDCVNLAVYGILRVRPDLVVSGINKGPNLGEDVVYSGTVSAAFEATLLEIPAFAMSLVSRKDFKFHVAANFALKMAKYIMQVGLPKETLLNINVPNLEEDEIPSFKITRQGKRVFGDAIVEKIDPRGKKYYWIGGEDQGFQEIEGTDFYAIANHNISITPLRVDLTNYSAVKELKGWRF